MKKLLFIFFLYFIGFDSQAQCIADAGNDTAICASWVLDTLYLGGSPSVMGGIPPYTYTWSCTYTTLFSTFTASDFLDDTTIANPLLTNYAGDTLTFLLTITDSIGNSCKDSISIRFSKWAMTLDDKYAFINQGDSAQLYKSIYGGIPPITYLWSPSTGLANPADVYTWAKPDTTTSYSLLVTDDIGCQAYDGFKVYVYPTGLNDHSKKQIKITVFPNPTTGKFTVQGATGEIQLYDLFGRLVLRTNKPEIDMSSYPAGLYIWSVGSARGKLVKE